MHSLRAITAPYQSQTDGVHWVPGPQSTPPSEVATWVKVIYIAQRTIVWWPRKLTPLNFVARRGRKNKAIPLFRGGPCSSESLGVDHGLYGGQIREWLLKVVDLNIS